MKAGKPTHIFTDLGGVLLTNRWDRALRKQVAEHFQIDPKDMDERHHLTYDTYESGKIPLSTYLNRVVFYRPRDYTEKDVVDFILHAAKPLQESIDLVKE